MSNVLIMVFECNTSSKSDYIYIKSVLDQKYQCLKIVHFEKIFCGSKCELCSESTTKKIKRIMKKYIDNPIFQIVFFADVDTGSDEDERRNELIQKYGSFNTQKHVVWFNSDIEEVFIGKKISKKEKKKVAEKFASNPKDASAYKNLRNNNALFVKKVATY